MVTELKRQSNRSWYLRNRERVLRESRERSWQTTHRQRERKLSLIVMAGSLCEDCGMNLEKFPMCADLDHVDPSTKSASVCELTNGPLEPLLEEWQKCDLVCSNCHRIRTARY